MSKIRNKLKTSLGNKMNKDDIPDVQGNAYYSFQQIAL